VAGKNNEVEMGLTQIAIRLKGCRMIDHFIRFNCTAVWVYAGVRVL